MIGAGVLGSTGYTGVELIRLLARQAGTRLRLGASPASVQPRRVC